MSYENIFEYKEDNIQLQEAEKAYREDRRAEEDRFFEEC